MEDLEKEFIPYDRALKMKDIGFDEPCFATYHYPSKSLVRVDADSQGVKNSNLVNFTSAPTFSQAFRWFREKYSYDISIVRRTLKAYQFEIQKLVYEGDDYFFNDFSFDTYEEAELACLDKLLEIVEQKQKEDGK